MSIEPASLSGSNDEIGESPQLGVLPAASGAQRFFRSAVERALRHLQEGSLRLEEQGGTRLFRGSESSSPLEGHLRVLDPEFYRAVALGGSLGAAESYLRHEWESDDLVSTMRLLARNAPVLERTDRGWARLLRPLRRLAHWLHQNSRQGSQRNIAAHYDLSNEFFALFLDRTMTYSSGMFSAESTLEQASLAKYDAICRKLQLTPRDHVLEIGCGWGGFAQYAAEQFGCRITATTISDQQFQFARRRIADAGLAGRVHVVRQDYRDLEGRFDKLVSIEMIEAVGEKYLDTYFQQCSQLLAPDGLMVLQAITMPDDRYDRYRRSVDFIQKHVFPGGFLPSFSAIGQSLRQVTDFRLIHSEDFGLDYARTLQQWRERFWDAEAEVRALGFDDRFLRLWNYYLCYCEAGFRESQVGVSQITLAKPRWLNRRLAATDSSCRPDTECARPLVQPRTKMVPK